MNLLRLILVIVLCILPGTFTRAETDLELVAKIDAAVAKAVKFLASKQSPDGAWRSDIYAPFKEGDALTPLVMTAILPLPIDESAEAMRDHGQKYLVELSKRTFEHDNGLKSLAYPVYTAANTTIALHQNRRAEDEAIRAKWVQSLRDLQLTEATGWKPDDIEYGGWTYGHVAAQKPAEGQVLGTLDQPNISATANALMALQVAGVTPRDITIQRGAKFVERLQNSDGGFFFVHGDDVRNKAGRRKGAIDQRNEFLSYGSATADGLRALRACGYGWSSRCFPPAMNWIDDELTPASPDNPVFRNDRLQHPEGLFFYFCAALGNVCDQQRFRHSSDVAYGEPWTPHLAAELLRRQFGNGSWASEFVDQREDDPIVATSFAVQCLHVCRMLTHAGERGPIKQVQNTGFTCHARDASIYATKLRFEPATQKNTLGYWINENDFAYWKLMVDRPSLFEVIIWQGCGAGQGGSEIEVSVFDDKLKLIVEDTGHFQNFKKRSVGQLRVKAKGNNELKIKCLRKAKDAVVDVRQIRLVPVDGKGPGRAVGE